MPSNAEFSIDADPFVNRGFDALNSEVLTLVLEDAPALDIRKTVYETVQRSEGAPDIAELGAIGSGGAQPAPNHASPLDITMPAAGTHSYIIRCTVNNGTKPNAAGVEVPEASFVKERLIAIRNAAGQRKICPAEGTQYDDEFGWSGAFGDAVDAFPAVPAVTVDNRVARFDGILGNVQNSGVTLTDADALTDVASMTGPAAADLDLNAVAGQAVALQVNATDVLRALATHVELAQRILSAVGTDLDLDTPTGRAVNLQINNVDQLRVLAASVSLTPALLQFVEGAVAPVIGQAAESAGAGDDLTLEAQGVTGATQIAGDARVLGGDGSAGSGNCDGGHAYLQGGAPSGTGDRGNVAIGSTSVAWQNAEQILFIANLVAIPTGDPTGGAFITCASGDLKMYGSGGMETDIAVAGADASKWVRHHEIASVTAFGTTDVFTGMIVDTNGEVGKIHSYALGRDGTDGDVQTRSMTGTAEQTTGTLNSVGNSLNSHGGEGQDGNFAFNATNPIIAGSQVRVRVNGFQNAGNFELFSFGFVTAPM